MAHQLVHVGLVVALVAIAIVRGWSQKPFFLGQSSGSIASNLNANRFSYGQENVKIISKGGQSVMEVTYPKGSRNPSSGKRGGAGMASYFSPAVEATFSYELMFESGFDFNKGGKLPGMFGGDRSCTGGADATALKCFSTRYMWGPGGVGFVYYYGDKRITCGGLIQCSSGGHGHAIGKGLNGFRFQPGQWYELKQRVRLNTGTKRNGILQVWMNGRELFKITDLKYYGNADGKSIDGFLFSTFFGGNSEAWNSPKTQHTYFKNFKYDIAQAASPAFG